MVEILGSTFMFKTKFLLRKVVFTRNITKASEKKGQLYVLPTLAECHSTTATFKLRMSKGAYDVFALAIIF
jgi:hypothetical protein